MCCGEGRLECQNDKIVGQRMLVSCSDATLQEVGDVLSIVEKS